MSPQSKLIVVFTLVLCARVAFAQERGKAGYCELKRDPAAFNHKLVEVKTFFTHGFEDSMMFDPDCSSWPMVWVEYGGTEKTGTMYCCGESATRTRSKPLRVEDIEVTLTEDSTFRRFDSLLHQGRGSIVYATVVGRFFAGQKDANGGKGWGGYGHMGCCSLFVVEKVLWVDPHDNPNLDYGHWDEVSPACDYQGLDGTTESFQLRALERAGNIDSWAFDNPQRVAEDAVRKMVKGDAEAVLRKAPTVTKRAIGRMIYQWHPEKHVYYSFIVSRPYMLSIYSSDPKKIPWVVISAYKSSCGLR